MKIQKDRKPLCLLARYIAFLSELRAYSDESLKVNRSTKSRYFDDAIFYRNGVNISITNLKSASQQQLNKQEHNPSPLQLSKPHLVHDNFEITTRLEISQKFEILFNHSYDKQGYNTKKTSRGQ